MFGNNTGPIIAVSLVIFGVVFISLFVWSMVTVLINNPEAGKGLIWAMQSGWAFTLGILVIAFVVTVFIMTISALLSPKRNMKELMSSIASIFLAMSLFGAIFIGLNMALMYLPAYIMNSRGVQRLLSAAVKTWWLLPSVAIGMLLLALVGAVVVAVIVSSGAKKKAIALFPGKWMELSDLIKGRMHMSFDNEVKYQGLRTWFVKNINYLDDEIARFARARGEEPDDVTVRMIDVYDPWPEGILSEGEGDEKDDVGNRIPRVKHDGMNLMFEFCTFLQNR